MFACLLLPNFRLQAALRWRDPVGCGGHASGDLSVGSAVVEDGGVLVEVNAAARARGLVPGLTGPQAMARDAAVRIFSPEGAQEDSLSDLLVDQALGLSPDVERTASGVVTIDLRHAARGVCWQQLADGVVARFQNRTLQVQVGVAGTPDLAYLAAQGARPSAIVYQAAAFVGTLPLEALDLSEALALTFQDWGLRSVGDRKSVV